MWSEDHRPASVAGMVGNEEARAAVADWIRKWRPGIRPVLLVGPPGTGKTTLASLAAEEAGYDLVGVNASDARGKARLNEALAPAFSNAGVLGRQLVFVDEVDGIHGRADFGGAEALLRLVKEPAVPVVLAANSSAGPKMASLRKAATEVRLRPLPPRVALARLRAVLAAEGAELPPEAQLEAVRRGRGDLRATLNAAQALASGFSPDTSGSAAELDAEAGVGAFFAAKTHAEARAALRAMRSDPREKIGAFYNAVATSGLPAAQAARMMDAVSRADVLHGRIMATQQWRLLRYLDAALLGMFEPGSAARYSRYGLPWPLLNRLRWDGRALRRAVARRAARAGVSGSAYASVFLPHLLQCARNGALSLETGDEADDAIMAKEAARG